MRVVAPDPLEFNAMGTPEERLKRLRVNDVAELSTDDPLLTESSGGQLLVRFRPTDVVPKCSRYIPRMRKEEPSTYDPRVGYEPRLPEWKIRDDVRDVLPQRRG